MAAGDPVVSRRKQAPPAKTEAAPAAGVWREMGREESVYQKKNRETRARGIRGDVEIDKEIRGRWTSSDCRKCRWAGKLTPGEGGVSGHYCDYLCKTGRIRPKPKRYGDPCPVFEAGDGRRRRRKAAPLGSEPSKRRNKG